MKFIYKNEQGAEVGPLELSALIQCIESDKINPNTRIRNAIMGEWRIAGKLPSLKPALEAQLARWKADPARQADENWQNYFEAMDNLLHPAQEKSTAFVRKFDPEDASCGRRLSAFVLDALLIGIVAFFLFGFGVWRAAVNAVPYTPPADSPAAVAMTEVSGTTNSSGDNAEPAKKLQSVQVTRDGIVWHKAPGEAWLIRSGRLFLTMNLGVLILLPLILLYYGLTLGYYAQSFGMWFWGIFIVKEDIGEVNYQQAFLWSVAMLCLGILSPLAVLCTRRSIHDCICRVRVINVAGKSKV